MEICANGKTFSSVENFCEYFDISISSVRTKLKKGMSFQEIVDSIKFIEIDGLLFKSLSSISEYFGLDKNTYYNRVISGKDIKESLIYKPFNLKDCIYSKKGILFNNKEFSSFVEIANYYSIPFPLFALKVNETLSINEAIHIKNKNYTKGLVKRNPKKNNSYNISYNGKIYTSLKSLCCELNLPYRTINLRVSKGMPLKEAILMGVSSLKKSITLFGKEFPSVSSAYKYHNVSKTEVRYRVLNGMSIEEAILDIKEKKSNIINLEL